MRRPAARLADRAPAASRVLAHLAPWCLLLGACGPGAVDFEFAPPDGARFVLEETSSLSIEVPPTREIDLVIGGRSSVEIRRESAWRIHWTEKAETFRFLLGNREAFPELAREIVGLEFVTEFSDDGEAVATRGTGELAAALRRGFSAAGVAVGDSTNAEGMSEEQLSKWNQRVHSLVGRRLEIGETLDLPSRTSLDDGAEIHHRMRLTPLRHESCPGTDCVVVRVDYADDEAGLAPLRNQPIGYVLPLAADLGATVLVERVAVTGTGERRIDPKTGILYGEKVARDIRILAQRNSQPLVIVVRQQANLSLRPR